MALRTAFFCSLVCCLAALAPTAFAADGPCYHLRVAVDYALGTFEGEADVRYQNHAAVSLDEIYFRLWPNEPNVFGSAALEVTAASVNGQVAVAEPTSDPTILRVPVLLAPGQAVDVQLVFRGRASRFSSNARWTDEGLLSKSDWTKTMTLTSFYPVLAPYTNLGWVIDPLTERAGIGVAEASTYELELLLAPGVAVVPTPDAAMVQTDGRVLYSLSRHAVRDLSLALVPREWAPLTTTTDGITVRCWFASGPSDVAVRTLELATAAVHIYTTLFGPLPWQTVDIAEVQMRYLGIGLSGLVLIRNGYNKTPLDPSYEALLLHEMAHEWFGDAVGNDYIREPWLSEALAEYAAYVALQTAISPPAAEEKRADWQTFFNDYGQPSSFPELRVTSPADTYPGLATFLAFVYNGGPLALDELRLAIGDEAFFAALADYYARETGAIATGADFIASFERIGDGGMARRLFGDGPVAAP